MPSNCVGRAWSRCPSRPCVDGHLRACFSRPSTRSPSHWNPPLQSVHFHLRSAHSVSAFNAMACRSCQRRNKTCDERRPRCSVCRASRLRCRYDHRPAVLLARREQRRRLEPAPVAGSPGIPPPYGSIGLFPRPEPLSIPDSNMGRCVCRLLPMNVADPCQTYRRSSGIRHHSVMGAFEQSLAPGQPVRQVSRLLGGSVPGVERNRGCRTDSLAFQLRRARSNAPSAVQLQ